MRTAVKNATAAEAAVNMQRPIGIIWRGLVDITTRHTTKGKTSLVAGWLRPRREVKNWITDQQWRKRNDGNVEDNRNADCDIQQVKMNSNLSWFFYYNPQVDSERQQLQGAPVNQRPSHFIIQQTTHTQSVGCRNDFNVVHFSFLDEILYEKVWRSYQQMLNNSDICRSRHSIGLFFYKSNAFWFK